MKFTVERVPLVKMLELVGKKAPAKKRRDKLVRLSACAARVFVEANEITAGFEALVFEDGTCTLSHEVFLKLLKNYGQKPNITIEANDRILRFFSTELPITSYSAVVTPPGQFQVFDVSDLSVLQAENQLPSRKATADWADSILIEPSESQPEPEKKQDFSSTVQKLNAYESLEAKMWTKCPHCNGPLQPSPQLGSPRHDEHIPTILAYLFTGVFMWLILEGILYWSGEHPGNVTHVVLAVCVAAIISGQMKHEKGKD